MTKDPRVYIQHILDAIKDIESYTKNVSWEEFQCNKMMKDAVIRNLEVIGEAVKALAPSIRRAYPDVPWKQVAGMRDILIHEYFGVEEHKVWNVVRNRLPSLRRQLKKILKEWR